MIAKLFHSFAVARRKRVLRHLINRPYGQHLMSWDYELAYIERTGRLDWVDHTKPKLREPGTQIKPPAARPRRRD